MDDMFYVLGIADILIRLSRDRLHQWFSMGISRVLHRIICIPFSALLAIAPFAEVDWDATGIE